jgi:hypothetical protein
MKTGKLSYINLYTCKWGVTKVNNLRIQNNTASGCTNINVSEMNSLSKSIISIKDFL